jgi:hypothetical protein
MPTLGLVSGDCEFKLIFSKIILLLTVANNSSVDHKSQEKLLVSSSIVFQECGGIVVADRCIRRTLSDDTANGSSDSKSFEEHD